jgi:hypothetical protein
LQLNNSLYTNFKNNVKPHPKGAQNENLHYLTIAKTHLPLDTSLEKDLTTSWMVLSALSPRQEQIIDRGTQVRCILILIFNHGWLKLIVSFFLETDTWMSLLLGISRLKTMTSNRFCTLISGSHDNLLLNIMTPCKRCSSQDEESVRWQSHVS